MQFEATQVRGGFHFSHHYVTQMYTIQYNVTEGSIDIKIYMSYV